jgi:hypothetical protein
MVDSNLLGSPQPLCNLIAGVGRGHVVKWKEITLQSQEEEKIITSKIFMKCGDYEQYFQTSLLQRQSWLKVYNTGWAKSPCAPVGSRL